MRRRNFVSLVASFGAWPRLAWAKPATLPRVALLLSQVEGDANGLERARVFSDSLFRSGRSDVRVEVGWLGSGARAVAGAAVDSQPDVIVVTGTPGLAAILATKTAIPIVFVVVTNPVGARFVESLSRPGANITGFSTFEPEIAGKWLELLKEIAPAARRVGVLTDPEFAGFSELWNSIERLAPTLGMSVVAVHARDVSELRQQMATFGPTERDGLVVFPTPFNSNERGALFEIAAMHRIPAVYPFASHARAGGLVSYGFDANHLFERAAPYVTRILNGERAGDLAVQAPTRFELVVNLRTAALSKITIPPTLLARADEVIE